ncbi:hypothetical protein DFH07DRAFT_847764 [Mycena maculata]|uniref:Uncharacterized protein n=1 Tax=Mycena maculata TaxID=230809 RepID=A0AAD7HYP7_9AGAR|nr:hypothetical protein DFH07DRAFT_847764 [Mycena maculata]
MTSLEPLSTRISALSVYPQLQCPLFATLYPEIRNLVFRHALTEYDDLTRPYNKHEFYYRPGFQFTGRIDTNLLLTCRLVYLETHLVPMALNEHVFWRPLGGGPPGHYLYSYNTYFSRMTPQQRAAVQHVHFFLQMSWPGRWKAREWIEGLPVPKLLITIRHSDWPNWETNAPLDVQTLEGLRRWVTTVPHLQELKLELETIDAKREQLEELVQVVLGWKFPMTSEHALVHDGTTPTHTTWLGSSRMSPDRALPLVRPDRETRLLMQRWREDPVTMDEAFPLDLELIVRKVKFVLKLTGSSYSASCQK